MKRVRMLLRVSSNQQLDADGDLGIQRKIVLDYISLHDDWSLSKKEYFEGANSGYKNSVSERDILIEALDDATKNEYDILVVYKDDRIGRRMWEIGSYIMELKKHNVDVWTVKDGCISPSSDDVMGQMMLALRYGTAQKSSADTGMRVKDTAKKLVEQGRFFGGYAPYGYKFVFSGEISKHGRALKKLVVVEEQAEVVKYIFNLYENKEFGSTKIARILNKDERYKHLAPRDYWRSGQITSMLTNPIYSGYVSYKRKERTNGVLHRIGREDWIYAKERNESLAIISVETWNNVQLKRDKRAALYRRKSQIFDDDVVITKENTGMLTLIDVAYCGYCGAKMTNGSRYSYWKIKDTGEKKASRIALYRCTNNVNGLPHPPKTYSYDANEIEEVVFAKISEYLDSLKDVNKIFEEANKQSIEKKNSITHWIEDLEKEIKKIEDGIDTMKGYLPESLMGNYPVKPDILSSSIELQENKLEEKKKELIAAKEQYKSIDIDMSDTERLYSDIKQWNDVFINSDRETKRVVINRIVDKVIFTKEVITVKFKINLSYNKEESHPDDESDCEEDGSSNIKTCENVDKNENETSMLEHRISVHEVVSRHTPIRCSTERKKFFFRDLVIPLR